MASSGNIMGHDMMDEPGNDTADKGLGWRDDPRFAR
jgi:hypothetical protein